MPNGSNKIAEYLLDSKKHLFIPGHIEIRDATGTPRQHATGWLNKELLANNPAWMQFLAEDMAKRIADREKKPMRTIVLSADNYQASAFAAMLGAALSKDSNFPIVESVIMRVTDNPPRHTVTMNPKGYGAAERYIVADVASYTLHTLRRLVQSVKQDRGRSSSVILVACAMRLMYKEIDPAVNEVLSGIPVLIGAEIVLQQFGIINRCTICNEQKKPLTHVFDPVRGLRVFDAAQEEQERVQKAARIAELAARDDQYQADVRAGKKPAAPI